MCYLCGLCVHVYIAWLGVCVCVCVSPTITRYSILVIAAWCCRTSGAVEV